MTKKTCLLVASVLGAGHAAYAQPVDVDVDVNTEPGMYSYSWNDPRLMTGIGVGFQIGGGISGFVDSDLRDRTSNSVGGNWAARVTLGSHTPIGLDIQYTGSSTDLRRADTNSDLNTPNIFTTTVEGALRWNVLPHYMVNPYVFGGAGWQRLSINDEPTLADISASEDVATFPVGAGIAWRDLSGLVLDARGTYRFTTNSTLITGNDMRLDNWEASANLGYEF